MLGLLTKDFRLMLSRKQFFLMVLVIAVMLSSSGSGFCSCVSVYPVRIIYGKYHQL